MAKKKAATSGGSEKKRNVKPYLSRVVLRLIAAESAVEKLVAQGAPEEVASIFKSFLVLIKSVNERVVALHSEGWAPAKKAAGADLKPGTPVRIVKKDQEPYLRITSAEALDKELFLREIVGEGKRKKFLIQVGEKGDKVIGYVPRSMLEIRS